MVPLALAIAGSIIIFFVAFLSPTAGSRIQRWLNRMLAKIRQISRGRPRPIRFMLRAPSDKVHSLLHGSATAGKRTRRVAHEKTPGKH